MNEDFRTYMNAYATVITEARKKTAGILLYSDEGKVFLVHPYGMTGSNAWGIPKGHIEDGEHTLQAAKREFEEETNIKLPKNEPYLDIGSIDYKKWPKTVYAFAVKGTGKEKFAGSNIIQYGHNAGHPEVDKGEWFTFEQAKKIMHSGQEEFIKRLEDNLT